MKFKQPLTLFSLLVIGLIACGQQLTVDRTNKTEIKTQRGSANLTGTGLSCFSVWQSYHMFALIAPPNADKRIRLVRDFSLKFANQNLAKYVGICKASSDWQHCQSMSRQVFRESYKIDSHQKTIRNHTKSIASLHKTINESRQELAKWQNRTAEAIPGVDPESEIKALRAKVNHLTWYVNHLKASISNLKEKIVFAEKTIKSAKDKLTGTGCNKPL